MKRSMVLMEVMIAVLLVSLVSVYLFRGYRLFSKVSLKSRSYLDLLSLAEEKIFYSRLEALDPSLAGNILDREAGEGFNLTLTVSPAWQEKMRQVRIFAESGNAAIDIVFLQSD